MSESEGQAIRQATIKECQETLLKQLVTMVYRNGYGIEAVAKSTILSLPALMNIKSFDANVETNRTKT